MKYVGPCAAETPIQLSSLPFPKFYPCFARFPVVALLRNNLRQVDPIVLSVPSRIVWRQWKEVFSAVRK